ncbi:hypothetical protein BDV97DRAFT_347714 [Delphinella strobiligena]|nr:hypothetical protein BDV97DRAFT_347714 [Delphinella strobiligena]
MRHNGGASIMILHHFPGSAIALCTLFASLSVSAVSAASSTATISASTSSTSIKCSIHGTSVISNAAQATSLASACPSFTGIISISASESIALHGIKTIHGGLIASAVPSLSTISSDSIKNITGSLSLSDLPDLATFNFTQLAFLGSLDIYNLTASARSLSFFQTLQQVNFISIQQTGLFGLEGFDVQQVNMVTIEYNPNLTSVDLGFTNVAVLTIAANHADAEVSLPNLEWVHNIRLANCSAVRMPALTRVNYVLQLEGNSFSEFGNAPSVHTIGDELWINDNSNLRNITLPELQRVGGHMVIQGNPQLSLVNEFSRLEKVGGYVQMDGGFEDISFPSLKSVVGYVEVNSTTALNCSILTSYAENGIISGTYRCHSLTSSAVSPPKRSRGPLSKGDTIAIAISVPLGFLSLASVVGLLVTKHLRLRKRLVTLTNLQTTKSWGTVEAFMESPTDTVIVELCADKEINEGGRNENSIPGPEWRHELDARERPIEMPTHGGDILYELEGDTVHPHKLDR